MLYVVINWEFIIVLEFVRIFENIFVMIVKNIIGFIW